jgi:hypothetical protein
MQKAGTGAGRKGSPNGSGSAAERSTGIEGLSALSPAAREEAAPALASAFGTTLWIAIALIGVALLPALLLPKPPREQGAAAERIREAA